MTPKRKKLLRFIAENGDVWPFGLSEKSGVDCATMELDILCTVGLASISHENKGHYTLTDAGLRAAKRDDV